MVVLGDVKVNKLTLQGKGNVNDDNLVMEVQDSQFTMFMGNDLLMALRPDEASDEQVTNSAPPSVLVIGRDTVIDGRLTVNHSASVSSNCHVTSNIGVVGGLTVGSNLIVSGSADIGGVSVRGNMDVTGDAAIRGDLILSGNMYVQGSNIIQYVLNGIANYP
jgi:hypothetical protein